MESLTLLTTLASLAAIIGLLYLMVIGQKSLPEWWREKHPLAIQGSPGNAQSPQGIPIRPTPPKRRNILFGGHPFTNLRKLMKARQLYKQAGVEAHPAFDGLLNRTVLQIAVLVLLGILALAIAYILWIWITNLRGDGPFSSISTPIASSTPTPITYQILIIRSDGDVERFNCGDPVQLSSNAQIRLAISPIQDGKLEWKSLAQEKALGMNSPVPYTPGKFIENIDIVSYYRNDAKLCWLLLMKSP